MRIVVDIDGTLTKIKYPQEKYLNLKPYKKLILWLKKMKEEGNTIIIYSSRGMRTHNNNVAGVLADYGYDILRWLKKNKVPFDELYLGKPLADIIIDDQSIVYNNLKNIKQNFGSTFPVFIITMAGEGRRFKQANFNEPKFAIKAKDKPLAYWALRSLPLDIGQKIIFISSIKNAPQAKKVIKSALMTLGYNKMFIKNKVNFLFLKERTAGQALTALYARDLLKRLNLYENTPLVIYNIDTFFESSRLRQRIMTFTRLGYVGLLGLFFSKRPNLSFAKIKDELVLETAEKKCISNLASTGLYAFKSMKIFEEAVEKYGNDVIQKYGELYIAPLYNYLIKKYKYITFDVAEKVYLLGSPEELRIFENGDKIE